MRIFVFYREKEKLSLQNSPIQQINSSVCRQFKCVCVWKSKATSERCAPKTNQRRRPETSVRCRGVPSTHDERRNNSDCRSRSLAIGDGVWWSAFTGAAIASNYPGGERTDRGQLGTQNRHGSTGHHPPNRARQTGPTR